MSTFTQPSKTSRLPHPTFSRKGAVAAALTASLISITTLSGCAGSNADLTTEQLREKAERARLERQILDSYGPPARQTGGANLGALISSFKPQPAPQQPINCYEWAPGYTTCR